MILHTYIWRFYIPIFDDSTYLYLTILYTYIWQFYIPIFDDSTYLYLTILHSYIWRFYILIFDDSIYIPIFDDSTYRYLTILHTDIWRFYIPIFDDSTYLYLTVLWNEMNPFIQAIGLLLRYVWCLDVCKSVLSRLHCTYSRTVIVYKTLHIQCTCRKFTFHNTTPDMCLNVVV